MNSGDEAPRRCVAVKVDGAPCRAWPIDGFDHCRWHIGQAEAKIEAVKDAARAIVDGKSMPSDPEVVEQVRQYLLRVINGEEKEVIVSAKGEQILRAPLNRDRIAASHAWRKLEESLRDDRVEDDVDKSIFTGFLKSSIGKSHK